MKPLVEQFERRVAELSMRRESKHGPPADVCLVRRDVPDARLPDFDDTVAPALVPGSGWRDPTSAVHSLCF
jgi:hypothetical protein